MLTHKRKLALSVGLSFIFIGLAYAQVFDGDVEIRRDTVMPLGSCDQSVFEPNLPITNVYLNRIFRHIAQNNPQVFNGDLAPENICVGVRYNGAGGRAWALVDRRTLYIDSSLVARAQNDAQVAAVIGHELAHITMRHTPLDGIPVQGAERESLRSMLRERNGIVDQINRLSKDGNTAAIEELQRRDRELLSQINQRLTERYGRDFTDTWMESEADLVGAYYYLNAGFSSAEVAWRSQQVAIAEANNQNVHGAPPAVSAAERTQMAFQACGVTDTANPAEPVKVSNPGQRYADACWTVWKLRHGALREGALYASLYNDHVGIENLPDIEGEPSFMQAQEELLRYRAPDLK